MGEFWLLISEVKLQLSLNFPLFSDPNAQTLLTGCFLSIGPIF